MSIPHAFVRPVACAALLIACAETSPSAHAAGTCRSIPETACHEAARSSITLRDAGADSKTKLGLSLRGLPAALPAEVGDPSTATEYRVCVYDESAHAVELVASLEIPPGLSWSEPTGTSLTYVDRTGAADGVKRIMLSDGPHGGRVQLAAGGASLELPGPAEPDRYFAAAPAVTAQLVNDAGGCWSARFTGATHNDATRFAARARFENPTAGKRVFVSSSCFDGALGGLGGADAECQGLADAAGLSGTFRAWLADRSSSPATRFTATTLPYLRTDGALIAWSWNDLVEGTLRAPILLDEAAVAIDPAADCGPTVWTNVLADGAVAIADGYEFVCQDWTVAIAARSALTGNASLTGPGWTDGGPFGTESCGQSARLYCFEQ